MHVIFTKKEKCIACTWINLSTSDYYFFLADRSVIATELEDFFSQGLRVPQVGRELKRPLFQSPAPDRLSNELRPGCLEMYPNESVKTPRMDLKQTPCSAAWLFLGRKKFFTLGWPSSAQIKKLPLTPPRHILDGLSLSILPLGLLLQTEGQPCSLFSLPGFTEECVYLSSQHDSCASHPTTSVTPTGL